jgi:hypothetical protein
MDFVIEFLTKYISSIGTYILFFLLGSAVLFHLSKLKNERQVALSTLQIIHAVLKSKLGEKSDMLISIWIEGLKKIQDGEFSDEDGVDQFVRYLRLAAKNNGIELDEADVQAISTLVLSTLQTYVGKKPKEIDIAVNKFAAMSQISSLSIK